MHTEYTDADTEQARQAERSSAGLRTQQLSLPAAAGELAAAPALPRQRPNLLGLGLVALGAILLIGRGATASLELTGGMVLLTIASVFYFFGFWRRIYGLIIPAGILAGLSVGVTFADMTSGVSVLWGLALGFLSVFFFGSLMFQNRHPWPVIPAVILFAVGAIVAVANLPGFLAAGMIWLPLLLIGAGLFLGWRRP